MASDELFFFLAAATKGFKQFAGFVKFMDQVRAVAHADKNRAVRSYGDTGESSCASRNFAGGFVGNSHHDVAIEIEFDSSRRYAFASTELGAVDVLLVSFGVDLHAMHAFD